VLHNPPFAVEDSVTFTATPNIATLAPAYQWKRNGNNIGGATNATYSTASLVNNDQISCELTTNANCVSPNSATSNIIIIAVSGTVTPAISIAASTDSVCRDKASPLRLLSPTGVLHRDINGRKTAAIFQVLHLLLIQHQVF
jgi:hypothetical protein